jgi:Ala-tRNA(Pro) deacylase
MDKYEEVIEKTMQNLNINFKKMEHEEMFTMDQYEDIERKLGTCVPKNLFLCNQQHTKFYLLLMPGNKRFKTKELSKQINSPRLSFAFSEELGEGLHSFKGCTNPFALLFDTNSMVKLLIDEDLLEKKELAFHPCTNKVTLSMKTDDFLDKFLVYAKHGYTKVALLGE